MTALDLRENCLGFELYDGDRLVALYRAREELPATESPKPCFAPIYTPSGELITEYRPGDHAWHTGLYFGWVHANGNNLWGGPLYNEASEQYEMVPTHGRQRHDSFSWPSSSGEGVEVCESLDWLDCHGGMLAREMRSYSFRKSDDIYLWTVETAITPSTYPFVLGASRKSHYSGFELRMGPPFVGSGDPAEGALHRSSEGLEGHGATMGERARWVSAAGRRSGAVVMMDHPDNPRYPSTWFTRFNLLGAALLMPGDLKLEAGALALKYGFAILDAAPDQAQTEELYQEFIAT